MTHNGTLRQGYEAACIASQGYDTWGVDLSPNAVKEAKEYVLLPCTRRALCQNNMTCPRWASSSIAPEVQAKLDFQVQDFFKFDVPGTGFDLVFDYT